MSDTYQTRPSCLIICRNYEVEGKTEELGIALPIQEPRGGVAIVKGLCEVRTDNNLDLALTNVDELIGTDLREGREENIQCGSLSTGVDGAICIRKLFSSSQSGGGFRRDELCKESVMEGCIWIYKITLDDGIMIVEQKVRLQQGEDAEHCFKSWKRPIVDVTEEWIQSIHKQSEDVNSEGISVEDAIAAYQSQLLLGSPLTFWWAYETVVQFIRDVGLKNPNYEGKRQEFISQREHLRQLYDNKAKEHLGAYPYSLLIWNPIAKRFNPHEEVVLPKVEFDKDMKLGSALEVTKSALKTFIDTIPPGEDGPSKFFRNFRFELDRVSNNLIAAKQSK